MLFCPRCAGELAFEVADRDRQPHLLIVGEYVALEPLPAVARCVCSWQARGAIAGATVDMETGRFLSGHFAEWGALRWPS